MDAKETLEVLTRRALRVLCELSVSSLLPLCISRCSFTRRSCWALQGQNHTQVRLALKPLKGWTAADLWLQKRSNRNRSED